MIIATFCFVIKIALSHDEMTFLPLMVNDDHNKIKAKSTLIHL